MEQRWKNNETDGAKFACAVFPRLLDPARSAGLIG